MTSAANLVAALLGCAALAACAVTRGPFEPGIAAPLADGVTIAVVGGAGARGPAARETARALTEVLGPPTADRNAMVLLVGDYAPHRFARGRGRRAKAPAKTPVVTQATVATPRVGSRFALRGVAERHHQAGPLPTTAHAVVRVGADGRGDTISRCEARTCRIDSTAAPGVVDLVLLDLEPWRVPTDDDDAPVARIESLLDAISRLPADTPRILVLSLPVEGAYETGQGAQFGPTAMFHLLPPALARHLETGMFVGVIAGGERSLHLSPDLTAAIQRSDRVWLRSPLWQVVSGNANDPRAGRVAHRSTWRGGIVHRPVVSTSDPGFAVVRIDGSASLTIDLVAQHRGRWHTARTRVPLRPAPHPATTGTRQLNPCPFCDDKPAGERR